MNLLALLKSTAWNRFAQLVFGLALLTAGCASRVQTVTPAQLRATIQKHSHETMNEVSYAGTEPAYHYIFHSRIPARQMYRVPAADLLIARPFPKTDDRTQWRSLNWDLQPRPQELDRATISNLLRGVECLWAEPPRK